MTEDTSTAAAPRPARTAVRTVTVGSEEAGQRVDRLLARLLEGVPRSHLFRLLRKGEVRLNGKRVKPEARVAEGDQLRLPPVQEQPARDPDAPRPVPRKLIEQVEAAVIHQDDRLLVLDKPSGIAVHGGSGIGFGIIEALRASRPDETLELVHRLDRDTSGCLLVARRRSTLRSLHALLREDDAFDKRYLALVRGKWELGRKLIDAPLRTDLRVGGERTVKVDPHGKPAASEFRVVQFYGRLATLVEVHLKTGRTHQIRVHLSSAGHPIVGDDKYGDFDLNRTLQRNDLRRMFLHAWQLGLIHPVSQQALQLQADLPPELMGWGNVADFFV